MRVALESAYLRFEKCSEFHACVHHCDEATHTSACAAARPRRASSTSVSLRMRNEP